MNSRSSVYAYELTTHLNAATQASVGAVSLAILDHWSDARLHVWIVAVSENQALALRGLPRVITPRLLGAMKPTADGEALQFLDLGNNQTYTVSVEALSW